MTEEIRERGPYLSLTGALDPTLQWHQRKQVGLKEDLYAVLDHPTTVFDLLHSGYSVSDFLLKKWIPSKEKGKDPASLRWFGRIIPELGVTILGGYLLHESGHIYHILNTDRDQTAGVRGFNRAIANDAAGLNASIWGSQETVLQPYQGIMSDLAYISHKMDLPAYHLFQEKIYFKLREKKGDIGHYLAFRQERNGTDEEGAVAALGLWFLADLVWSNQAPLRQVWRYGFNGENPQDPYSPGESTLKTTGSLSPVGPLYGLKFYHFLEGHTEFPSAIMAEAWSSFVRQGKGLFPFGAQVSAKRLALPIHPGSFGLGLSASLTVSEQDAQEWRFKEDIPDIPTILFAGSLGLHMQGSRGEFFLEGRAKQRGHLQAELFESGATVLAGVQLSFPP